MENLKKNKLPLKPRGTRDIIPPESIIYQKIFTKLQKILNNVGYSPIISPTYEYEELFSSSGEFTDVQKEMFIFNDRKGRKLALSPEGTPSTVRLVCQNKLINPGHPLRLYYWGQKFRYGRPQKDRYREFTQLGVELVNASGIVADAELLWIIKKIIENFNLSNLTTIHWNYLGNEKIQQKYKKMLKESLKNKKLCLDCQNRYEVNPLRILDCKICQNLNFPDYKKILEAEDLFYLERLSRIFNELKINHFYNQKLVRGLDYYNGLVFEIYLNQNENAILGGGRYNELFKRLGNINVPAAGFALGVDRLINHLSSLNEWKKLNKPDILFLILDYSNLPLLFEIRELLEKNYRTISNLKIKERKNVFRNINYYSPRLAIILEKNSEKIILVKDCEKKKDYLVDKNELVKWTIEFMNKYKNSKYVESC